MKRSGSQTRLTGFVLSLIVVIVGGLTPSAPAAQTLNPAPEHPQLESMVKDMQIVVRHRDHEGREDTYRHFSPTRLQREGELFVIAGTITESPDAGTADITISLKTAKWPTPTHRYEAGKAWWEDIDLREDTEQGGD